MFHYALVHKDDYYSIMQITEEYDDGELEQIEEIDINGPFIGGSIPVEVFEKLIRSYASYKDWIITDKYDKDY